LPKLVLKALVIPQRDVVVVENARGRLVCRAGQLQRVAPTTAVVIKAPRIFGGSLARDAPFPAILVVVETRCNQDASAASRWHGRYANLNAR
jgi:hypothetical protein